MMKLYNKYFPKNIDDYYLHTKLQDILKNNEIIKKTNIIIYGNNGVGKKSFLNLIYPGQRSKNITNSENLDYTIIKSNNTIEINCREFCIYNKNLLYETIKNIGETREVLNNYMKVIVLHNVEYLEKDYQYILKKLLDQYYMTAKFIFITNDFNKIINSIKSRCLSIKISNPPIIEIKKFIYDIKKKENISISDKKLDEIINKYNYNVKNMIFELEFYSMYKKKYKETLDDIFEKILKTLNNKNFTNKLIDKWEELVYKLLVNFTLDDNFILITIFNKLFSKSEDKNYIKELTNITIEFNKRIINSNKSIIHIILYLKIIFDILKKYDVII